MEQQFWDAKKNEQALEQKTTVLLAACQAASQLALRSFASQEIRVIWIFLNPRGLPILFVQPSFRRTYFCIAGRTCYVVCFAKKQNSPTSTPPPVFQISTRRRSASSKCFSFLDVCSRANQGATNLRACQLKLGKKGGTQIRAGKVKWKHLKLSNNNFFLKLGMDTVGTCRGHHSEYQRSGTIFIFMISWGPPFGFFN